MHSRTPPTHDDTLGLPLRPLAVTVQTARALTGLGNTTLWQLISAQKLQTVSVGRRRLIIFKSLEALLNPDFVHCKVEPRRRNRPPKG
jgi:hypothetical protein